jgi:hypothetical protein
MNPLDILSPLGAIIEKVVAFIPDPVQRAKAFAEAQSEMITALSASDAAQAATNTAEAANPSIFVSGWRPAFGWLGVVLVAYAMILRDVLVTCFDLPLPSIDTADMWPLITGMLGLTAARSYDKAKGFAR